MIVQVKLRGRGEGVGDCLERRQKRRPEEMEEKRVPTG